MKRRIAAIFAVLMALAFSLSVSADSSDYSENITKMAQADVPANMAINEDNSVSTSFNGDIAVFPDYFGADPETGNLCYYVRVKNETSRQMTIAVEGRGEMFPEGNLTGDITLKGGEEGYMKFGIIDDYTTHNYSEYPPSAQFWAKDSSGGYDAKSSYSSKKFGARPAEIMEMGKNTQMSFLQEQHWSCFNENTAFSYDEETCELTANSDGSITFVGTSENNELLFRIVSTVGSSAVSDDSTAEVSGSEEKKSEPIDEMTWISYATPEAFENIEPTYFNTDDSGAVDLGPLDFINDYVDLSKIDFSKINLNTVGSFLMEHDKEVVIAILALVILRMIRKAAKERKKVDNNNWQ